MVDASIGGKTAVNHAGAKNIVGLFYQPKAVVADVATLKTLPRRALVEGLGEVIKHAMIRDAGLLSLLEERLDDLLALEPELTTQVLARNVQIKGAVVGRGAADKAQVQHMVGVLLGIDGKLQADAADALAVAITHAHTRTLAARTGVAASQLIRR